MVMPTDDSELVTRVTKLLMIEELNEMFKSAPMIAGAVRRPLPKIVCLDGFRVSVQVGESLYCTPRDNKGPWTSVECGYPSESVPAWLDYATDPDEPCTSIYPYVPIELVVDEINRRNGYRNIRMMEVRGLMANESSKDLSFGVLYSALPKADRIDCSACNGVLRVMSGPCPVSDDTKLSVYCPRCDVGISNTISNMLLLSLDQQERVAVMYDLVRSMAQNLDVVRAPVNLGTALPLMTTADSKEMREGPKKLGRKKAPWNL